MKCSNCLYEDNCNLKKIAKDLIGCDGHSRENPYKENQVRCSCCGEWRDKNKVFTNTDGKKPICFDCW